MRNAIVLITALLVLGSVNYSIYQKERLLTDGRVVLLELAPVDPRSLIQGDYMALRFALVDTAFGRGHSNRSDDGRVVLKLDEQNVATFNRLDDGSPLAETEVAMRYRIRNGVPRFATNAFFFQEGDAKYYVGARYGEFRVSENGDCVLTKLRNAQMQPLGPEIKDSASARF